MKKLSFVTLILLLTSCGGEISSNLLKNISKQEKLSIDVFSLTFHKQMGSCAAQPIRHRMLTFAPIYISPNGTDTNIGAIDILLDEATKTYKAHYREFSYDQILFDTALTGNFEIVKGNQTTTNDELILENIGVVKATINNTRVDFIIKLDGDINQALINDEAPGRVIFSTTPFIADNCLL